ncbi:hypothetical protein [Chelatococcus reniformis]|uniref:Uncharacterized protein n=1 Tax=Chelatococcus reniformis TaxID=1494448 RepID=A0A916U565_9HYPH|nr:hypothetical protein [Chelatococcus reniformis]GGC60379.1 hypothetical protein GCM10010994_18770 [Chelatococcus reniformis]
MASETDSAGDATASPALIDHVAKALLDHDRRFVNPLRSWADIHRRTEYRDRAAVALEAAAAWRTGEPSTACGQSR